MLFSLYVSLTKPVKKKLQVSSAYLKYLKGPGTKILFEFVKEVPKNSTKSNPDIASLFGPLFFTWVVLLLFPVSSILLLLQLEYLQKY